MLSWYIDNKIVRAITYKLSALFALLYIMIYLGNIPASISFMSLWLAFIVSLGIGGLGFLINDFFDQEKDRIAGKHNLFLLLKPWQMWALTTVILACAFIPWFFFPFSNISLLFLVTEILLFALYSMKPFRLKERGLIGVVIDSLYAHVIPTCFAVYTFSLIITNTFVDSPIAGNFPLIFLWVFFTGVRNILVHQIEDLDNDKLSGTQTFLKKIGRQKMYKWMCFALFPLEFFLFLSVMLSMPYIWLAIPVYFIFIGLYFAKRKKTFVKDGKIDLEVFTAFFSAQILNEFYEKWFALVLLCIFMTTNIYFAILLGLHVLLFFPIYYDTVR